jgi:hypothetical protein
MYWDSFVFGASNDRQPTRTSASGGELVAGHPTGFEQWGTKLNPLTIATGSGKIYEALPLGYTKINLGNIDHIIGDNDSDAFDSSAMEQALWDMSLPAANSPRPFEQDKFTVKLEITITLERFGVSYPVGQKIVYNKTATCNDDVLFNDLSFAKQSQE